MCRNIRPLSNFAPPAMDQEVHAAALQFVRKVSGYTRPAQVNQEAFARAVEEVSRAARVLVDSLGTNAAPRDRDVEKERARACNFKRFGPRA